MLMPLPDEDVDSALFVFLTDNASGSVSYIGCVSASCDEQKVSRILISETVSDPAKDTGKELVTVTRIDSRLLNVDGFLVVVKGVKESLSPRNRGQITYRRVAL